VVHKRTETENKTKHEWAPQPVKIQGRKRKKTMAESVKNVFLNFTSEKMLHENDRKDGKGSVINVSIPVAQSKTGFGSFAVNPGQVLAATKKDGSIVDGYKSILLGQPDKTRKVSIATKVTKAGKVSYENIDMTNEQIVAEVAAARKAYRAAQATEPATEE
jgi:hypothetical protein